MRILLPIILFISLLATGCGTPKQTTAIPLDGDSTNLGDVYAWYDCDDDYVMTPDESFKILMELFDGVKILDSAVYWEPDFEERQFFPTDEDGYVRTRILKTFFYPDKGRLLIFASETNSDFRGDQVSIGAALFFKDKGEWVMNGYGFKKYIGQFGEYAKLDTADIALEYFTDEWSLLRINEYDVNTSGAYYKVNYFNYLDQYKPVFSYYSFSGDWGVPTLFDTCVLVPTPKDEYAHFELRIRHQEYDGGDEELEHSKTVGTEVKRYVYNARLDRFEEVK
jgi:hypothetical protein